MKKIAPGISCWYQSVSHCVIEPTVSIPILVGLMPEAGFTIDVDSSCALTDSANNSMTMKMVHIFITFIIISPTYKVDMLYLNLM